jgi:putative ABC transport system substrate-binding protein
MRRRDFVKAIVVSAATRPFAARAQSQTISLIGLLSGGFAASSAILVDSFNQGMRENGLVEKRDYLLDARWAEGDYTRLAALAAELAQRAPRVIIVTTIAAAHAAQQATSGTPIVMTGLIDPVGAGLIANLARPGGNTTGLSSMTEDTTVKGLELLRTVIPTLKTVAVLFNPANPGSRAIMQNLRDQAATLHIPIHPIEFNGPDTLENTLDAATDDSALLVVGDISLQDLRERIAALALQKHLPTVTSAPEFTDAGALLGYGPPRSAMYREAATYVKKILNGAKPADLPVEQPTLIELSINMRTAKALGVTIPDTLIARADRVIE